MITCDLDPGVGFLWPAGFSAGAMVSERLAKCRLSAFVKTSGGKGLHVVVPLKPKADWDQVKSFSKGISDAMASDSPERFVSILAKAKRRGKIFVDYLRKGRGATAVAPYRSEERRVGKECVSKGRSRWSPIH